MVLAAEGVHTTEVTEAHDGTRTDVHEAACSKAEAIFEDAATEDDAWDVRSSARRFNSKNTADTRPAVRINLVSRRKAGIRTGDYETRQTDSSFREDS